MLGEMDRDSYKYINVLFIDIIKANVFGPEIFIGNKWSHIIKDH